MNEVGPEHDDVGVPMVRISDYYVLDKDRNFACFVDSGRMTLFLNGLVRPMSGHGPEQLVHDIPIKKW